MSSSERNQLLALTKDLLQSWESARTVWKDEKAASFEQIYLKELEPSVNRAIHGMEKLNVLLEKVRKDCE
jgi:hypothetical protein